MKWTRQLTSIAQQIIIDHIDGRKQLIAVDATVGNGNDTLFLTQVVGENGKVYGFDIQPIAIEITGQKLKQQNIVTFTHLICDSHENIDKYVTTPIDIVMFNLGYLPQGDKCIITNVESTMCAIRKASELLAPNGIMTLLCYPGHSGGKEEEIAISQLLKEYNPQEFIASNIRIVNTKGYAPVLYIIVKNN